MQTETIIYIAIAGIIALLLALFQYVYRSKLKPKLRYLLTSLRFISVFLIAVLLINPNFEYQIYVDEKPTLVIAVDNSESISYLNQNENAQRFVETLKSDIELNTRFKLQTYSFGKTLKITDSLQFNEKQSNISEALKQIGEIYNTEIAPIVLVTDGNQTYGNDYSFKNIKQAIYPLILGDSIVHSDVSITQLNVNRYVYLKNKFPVEIIANYNGRKSVSTALKIWSGKSVVFKKTIQFNTSKKSEIITANLTANRVGVKTFRVELSPLVNEKNTANNVKNFGVDVIDQKTNIALVSDQLHPDLGALKKAIESNEQRNLTILKPEDYISKINDYQLVMMYQPNINFNSVLNAIKSKRLNTFIITGTTTNWAMLNKSQDYFKQTLTNQTEDYLPNLNQNFNTFIIDSLDFNNFPPLKSEFGVFKINGPHDVLLHKKVNGISTNDILLATFEANTTKHAILNGEDIWRWRSQAYIDTGGFKDFDNFINKIIQYLGSNKKRKRLNIDYNSFYNGNDNVSVRAQYFNKNFEFDANASLRITLKNKDFNMASEIPMLLNNGNYNVDLNGISPGFYDFTIKHNSEPISASGSFQILDYNVEQQFLNADINKLKSIAVKSRGKTYFSDETEGLISSLLSDNRYRTIQKSTKNNVPLIDWKYLLGLICISLFCEWFIRKYNGLI